MRFPKFTVAFITTLIFVFILPLIAPLGDASYLQSSFGYALFGTPVIFTYGILTSLLADHLSKKSNSINKRLLSLLYHILFGVAFILPYGIIFGDSDFTGFYYSVPFFAICGLTFFLVNEVVMKFD